MMDQGARLRAPDQTSRRTRQVCAGEAMLRHALGTNVLEERAPPKLRCAGAVESPRQPAHALSEFVRSHVRGAVVHIEKRAQVPTLGLKDATLGKQPVV